MKNKILIRISAVCMAMLMAFTPITVDAATIIKRGDQGKEVKELQASLRDMGYFKYHKLTGYYGRITENAVKQFQRDNGIKVSGTVGTTTNKALVKSAQEVTTGNRVATMSSNIENAPKLVGSLDWFKQVRALWSRGVIAEITDIDTGKTFQVKRTYGTNHADVEPLTLEDTKIIKEIWGGFSWKRRAVVVRFENCTLAGSMSAMPHAGIDKKPANAILNKRSGGYGRGYNLDSVKNNGADGVMDLHFNKVQKSMQDMVMKAANYINTLDIN